MIILDSLLIGGLKFVLGKIAAAVDAELDDDTALREELLAAQMRLEMGELTEDEFAGIERELLDGIRAIRQRRVGAQGSVGDLRVTGIEASVWSADDAGAGEPGAGEPGRPQP